MHNGFFRKKALVLSACLMLLWAVLGTGTTIAWFTDTTPAEKNSFVVGDLDLDVYYKNDAVTDYTPVDPDEGIFNDAALYEPGYTQVVYLKVVNAGDVDFDYKLSVDRYSCVDSISVLGNRLHLPQYLRFGVLFGDTEASLDRQVARAIADMDLLDAMHLSQYSEKDTVSVAEGDTRYVALVVYMPESVGNEANYKTGEEIPQIQLGITVYAQQAGAPLE